jgi:hypothetical protein
MSTVIKGFNSDTGIESPLVTVATDSNWTTASMDSNARYGYAGISYIVQYNNVHGSMEMIPATPEDLRKHNELVKAENDEKLLLLLC